MPLSTENKVLIGVLVGTLLIIVAGAFWGSKQTQKPALTDETVPTEQLVAADSPVLGPNDAKVTIVEFGDFQCPACGAMYPILKQLKADYKDQSVRFVFRHFPLPQHPDAPLAAEASEAAKAQGKFFEYHDLLFENQNDLSRAALEKYATQAGLNLDQFKKALDDHTYRDRVNQDRDQGQQIGINATPTIFIDGHKYNGDFSVAGFHATIDDELKK